MRVQALEQYLLELDSTLWAPVPLMMTRVMMLLLSSLSGAPCQTGREGGGVQSPYLPPKVPPNHLQMQQKVLL